MEHIEVLVNKAEDNDFSAQQAYSTNKPFIIANTIEAEFEEIKANHIIPVYIKDNETLISHSDFIETTSQVVREIFPNETILKPWVRLIHPIKGRVPEAKSKPVNELEEWEKTIYYERMAFIIEVPSITQKIDGNTISLTIGGVKSFSLDNLYNRKGSDEHFKVFIGFQNKVCTNLCVWTDGALLDLKVTSIGQLRGCIKTMLSQYNMPYHLYNLKQLCDYSITEQQFATLVGRCRMYPFLSTAAKNDIPLLHFGDTQMSTVVKDFYKDGSFCKNVEGHINLWKLYNLFTGANKSTYIDQFVERGIGAFNFTNHLKTALQKGAFSWYLS